MHDMTKDEIIREIEALRSIVAMAHDKLEEGQYIDMAVMQEKVDHTCQEVAELEPDEAQEVREPLNSFLEDLQAYASFVTNNAELEAATDGTTGDSN